MIFLDKQEWLQKYNELNAGAEFEFFKFETLPEYCDYNVFDWNAVTNKEMIGYINTAQSAIAKSRNDIAAQISRGVKIKRTRFLSFPLSKYILRQFSVFQTYVEMGVSIDIIESKNDIGAMTPNIFRDFLLFDDKHLLLLDNPNGFTSGGFYSDNSNEIKPYLEAKEALNRVSIPFQDYLENFNLSLINSGL